MALNVKKLAECVYDITSVACHALFADTDREDQDIDSRSLFDDIYGWAQEFERDNPDQIDYMLETRSSHTRN